MYPTSLLVVGLFTASASGPGRLDRVFASWEGAQRGVKSLVVRFTLETRDRAFDEREKAEGTFCLLRTSRGEVSASYVINPPKGKKGRQEHWSGLLNDGAVYLLNHDRRMAIRYGPPDCGLPRFLARYLNPFALLLDRKRAEEQYQLEVVKDDDLYTYLTVKPRRAKRSGWLPDAFRVGRVVLMNKAAATVPKGVPRQLWYADGMREYTFEITSWQANGVVAPKPEELARPEDRAGWQVIRWPLSKEE